jgi:hypothetical protein
MFSDIPLPAATYAQVVGSQAPSDTDDELFEPDSSDDEERSASPSPEPNGVDVCSARIAHDSHDLLTACPLAWGGGKPLGNFGVVTLCRGLSRNRHLCAMALAGQEVGSEGARALATALATQRSVRLLDLSDNEIGDEGARHLGAMLARNKRLRTLMVPANGITDVGVTRMCQGLHSNRALRELHLHGNRLNASAFASLTQLLECNNTLRKITLDFTRRRPSRHFEALCKAAAARSVMIGGSNPMPQPLI